MAKRLLRCSAMVFKPLVEISLSVELPPTWKSVLREELVKPYFAQLLAFVEGERRNFGSIYPDGHLVFNALAQTPFDGVRVVIVGQDPYHGPGQAHGLSFSVLNGVEIPPSLSNIFRELHMDLAIPEPKQGCLLPWASQGVLLLNATLTVRRGRARSHYGRGWEKFTDAIFERLVHREQPLVFMLWGRSATEKLDRVGNPERLRRHLVLRAPHPSPLSAHRGFFGCRHFSQANAFLALFGQEPINWALP